MNLDDLRKEIDKIDDNIADLLASRMEVVEKIGHVKAGGVIYRPEREKAIIERLEARLKGKKISKKGISAIFYEIFSLSRMLEGGEKIAFLGPFGTHTHEASIARFGLNADFVPLSSIEAVFKEIELGAAKFGVVPFENNTEGAVGASLDCLKKYENIKIIGEIYIDINHCLVSANADIKEIKAIYSHPHAYAQCRGFLSEHGLENVSFIAAKSTAHAAALAREDKASAAICSKAAAKMEDLRIVYEKIQDNENNRTRFFVLSDFGLGQSGDDKTSILAFTEHKPGGLFELLSIFKAHNINITKLESRPIKQKSFKSLFYLDFEGHAKDENIANALSEASKQGHNLKVLGSYAKSE